MKRTLIIFGVLIAALLLIVACTPKTPIQQAPPTDSGQEYKPSAPAPSPADTTAEQDMVVVNQEVIEIDDITTDLDVNGLDDLDRELAELDNLEI